MPEISRGLLDTSVVIDHDLIDADRLPDESAIAAVTLTIAYIVHSAALYRILI